MKKTYFTTNHFTRTIEGSKRAFDRAGKRIDPEYTELLAHMNDNPTYKLEIKENTKKKTYSGLTIPFIENYIKNLDDAETQMKEYEEIKKVFEGNYPKIKSWFLEKYGKSINIRKEKENIQNNERKAKIKIAKKKASENKITALPKAN